MTIPALGLFLLIPVRLLRHLPRGARWLLWAGLGPALLAGCRQSARSQKAVYLGPTAVYHLTDSTRELVPDEAATVFYQRRFNFHPQINQPLHRIVSSLSTDKVYLGLVLPPLPADLATLAQSDSAWELIGRRALPRRAVLAWLRSRRGHEWNVRYLGASAKSKNTHVIQFLTTDSATARRAYFAPKPFDGHILL